MRFPGDAGYGTGNDTSVSLSTSGGPCSVQRSALICARLPH
jgi:hypothetical protein